MYKICVNQINVHDMDKALEFYCDKLGFEAGDKNMYPQIVPLKNAGIYLILNKTNNPTKIDYPNQAQSLINFQTDNLEKTMHSLKQKGVEFIHKKPATCPVGVYAAFRDPSGNVHEFIEFRET